MIISAPSSSANIGPGFDALALALDLDFSIALNEQPRGGAWEPADKDHLAMISYREAGGVTPNSKIFLQSQIPIGRGLGFSGAARVAGAYAALLQNGQADEDARDHAFRLAGDLEGHDDNAAASAYGGFCVTTSGHVMRFDCEPEAQGLNLVVFVPEVITPTNESRTKISESFSKDDVVKTIGNISMLTGMLASNTFNDEVLKIVTQDFVHQDVRLKDCEPSAKAFQEFIELGAITQWLSGSGPSVAALVASESKDEIISKMEKLELECAFSLKEIPVVQTGVREVFQTE